MKEIVKRAHIWMDKYVKTFYEDDEEVMLGIKTKELHTGYVTSYARELAQHLQLDEHDVLLAELVGLFQDVGRFRQWKLYRTFSDALSEDHANLGLKVIDSQAAEICKEAKIEGFVFNMAEENNIVKAVKGEARGTVIKY